jgi:hypothetical protein
MGTYHQIFVASEQPVEVLLVDLAAVAGEELTPIAAGPVDFAAENGRDAIEVELSHDLEGDVLPYERYPITVTVRDYDRDMERQEQWARRVYDHLVSTGRYSLFLVFDYFELLTAAPPLR